MPLILTTGAPTASGHVYDDITGEQYEFPSRYDSLLASGEPFLYYMGTRGSPSRQAEYFGCGITGEIRPSRNDGKSLANVYDVVAFDSPVKSKDASGNYLETGSNRKTNWQNGVRRISDATYRYILNLGLGHAATLDGNASPSSRPERTSEHLRKIENYSVQVALAALRSEFSRETVHVMPPNNPGFDILVTRPEGNLHVEVKGTVLPSPRFHLSEGQRKHAERLGKDFRLIVVYGADTVKAQHAIVMKEGPIDCSKATLAPSAWTGVVKIV